MARKTECRAGVSLSGGFRSRRPLSLALADTVAHAHNSNNTQEARQEHHESQVILSYIRSLKPQETRDGRMTQRGPSEDPRTHGKSRKWREQSQAGWLANRTRQSTRLTEKDFFVKDLFIYYVYSTYACWSEEGTRPRYR